MEAEAGVVDGFDQRGRVSDRADRLAACTRPGSARCRRPCHARRHGRRPLGRRRWPCGHVRRRRAARAADWRANRTPGGGAEPAGQPADARQVVDHRRPGVVGAEDGEVWAPEEQRLQGHDLDAAGVPLGAIGQRLGFGDLERRRPPDRRGHLDAPDAELLQHRRGRGVLIGRPRDVRYGQCHGRRHPCDSAKARMPESTASRASR